MRPTARVAALLVPFAMAAGWSAPAAAHPHVFVEARAEIVFDPQGQIVAVRNIWRFDEAFSAYAKQGLEKLHNGRLSPKSLEALARVNIHALATYHYFSYARIDGKRQPIGEGSDQKLDDDGEHLTLTFTVTPAVPYDPRTSQVTLDLYDPEYFAAVGFVKDRPVKLSGAPKSCRTQVFTPTGLTPAAAAALARVPASQRTLPPELQSLTGGIENGVVIDCPGG